MRTDSVMVYSLSKLAGFSATRIGWALVKDDELAALMSRFIFLQSTAPSAESQLRAVKVLRAIEHSLHTDDDYFLFARNKLADRWRRLSAIFNAQQGPADKRYFLDCAHGNIFAWIRCGSAILQRAETCASKFMSVGIAADEGTDFGAGSLSARVVIGYHESTFELQLLRFSKLLQSSD